tara:strand:+ start:9193 stop:10341 length:1149 start_codon:yes stop_codon:yes gene_type:complete
MELDKEKDLFLLNIEPIIGENLIKICDENIYVDNNGAPLRVIQWFYFQLVLLVGLYLELDGPKIDNKGEIVNTFNSNGTKLDFLIYKKDDNKYDYAKDENGSRIIIDKETGIPLDKIGLRNFIFNLSLNHGRTGKMLWDKLRDKVLNKGTKLEQDKQKIKSHREKFEKYGLINFKHYPLGYTKFKLRLNDTKDDVIGWDDIEEIAPQILITLDKLLDKIFKKYKENVSKEKLDSNLDSKLYGIFKILFRGDEELIIDDNKQLTSGNNGIVQDFDEIKKIDKETAGTVLETYRKQHTLNDGKQNDHFILVKEGVKEAEGDASKNKMYINLNNENIKQEYWRVDDSNKDKHLIIILDDFTCSLEKLNISNDVNDKLWTCYTYTK